VISNSTTIEPPSATDRAPEGERGGSGRPVKGHLDGNAAWFSYHTPQPWRFPYPRRRDAVPILLLMAVVMFTGVLLMSHNMTFSRTDELEHFDYVTSLVDRHTIPRKGDLYTQQAIRAQACWRYQIAMAKIPPCTAATLDPHDFGNHGVTSAGGYPPVYYAATAAVAVPLHALLGFDSLYLPARLVSLLWLALGAVLTYLLVRSLRVGRWAAVAVALVAALGPFMMAQGTTVNPDSLSLLAGAGTALAWLQLRGSPRWRATLGLAGVLALVTLVKPNFLVVPVAVVTAEAALALQGGARTFLRRHTWSRRAPFGRVVLAGILGSAAGVAWMSVFFVLDRPGLSVNPATVSMGARPWDTDLALRWTPFSYAPPVDGPFFVQVLDQGIMTWFISVGSLLVVAGAVAATMVARRQQVPGWTLDPGGGPAVEPVRALGYLTAASFTLAAPVMYAITAAGHRFFPYPSRYSLFIVPLGLAALAGVSGRIRVRLFVPLALVAVATYWIILEAF
jgi:hypothetical protein